MAGRQVSGQPRCALADSRSTPMASSKTKSLPWVLAVEGVPASGQPGRMLELLRRAHSSSSPACTPQAPPPWTGGRRMAEGSQELWALADGAQETAGGAKPVPVLEGCAGDVKGALVAGPERSDAVFRWEA